MLGAPRAMPAGQTSGGELVQRTFQTIVLLLTVSGLGAAQVPPPAEPLVRTVDLDIGESQDVLLSNGRTVAVRLVDLAEVRDDVTDGVGWARVTVEVDGKRVEIASSPYGLKMEFEGVQLDSPITGGYLDKANGNMWALDKDARIRLWPKGSPGSTPGPSPIPRGSVGSPAPPRWPTSLSTWMGETPRTRRASTTTTASTSAAAKGESTWWPRRTAWSFLPATSASRALRTHPRARGTTSSTSAITGGGSTATAT